MRQRQRIVSQLSERILQHPLDEAVCPRQGIEVLYVNPSIMIDACVFDTLNNDLSGQTPENVQIFIRRLLTGL